MKFNDTKSSDPLMAWASSMNLRQKIYKTLLKFEGLLRIAETKKITHVLYRCLCMLCMINFFCYTECYGSSFTQVIGISLMINFLLKLNRFLKI